MEDKERDEILYRLDERMERVDRNLTRLDRRIKAAEQIADEAHDKATKNERNLGNIAKFVAGVGTLLTGVVSALSAKLTGIL